jgi:hypothetical protein
MKSKIIKKEDRAHSAKLQRRGGFALLFSVLVSSLLLTIALSILNISLKELAISTASRQSIYAFYAADSGREYVKYLDTRVEDRLSTLDGDNKIIKVNYPVIKNDTFSGELFDLGGPNFSVSLKKDWVDVLKTSIKTTITSDGFDTDSGDRVERSIEQTYQ